MGGFDVMILTGHAMYQARLMMVRRVVNSYIAHTPKKHARSLLGIIYVRNS